MEIIHLTDEQKKGFLEEHFYYEVEMLEFSVTRLEESRLAGNQDSVNMAIDACLLHARNLREFLYSDEKKYGTDARAYEFVRDKSEWRKDRPPETHWIKEVKKRAHVELAHLTYKRHCATPPEKDWDCGAIRRDFLRVVRVFLDHLPKEYIGDGLCYIRKRCLEVDTSICGHGVVSTAIVVEYFTKWYK